MILIKNKTSAIFLLLIIVINFVSSLSFINRPLYSRYDSARQIHTSGITRELYKHFDIFDTEIYFSGEKRRYIEEFPIYNSIIVAGYKIFGENETIGRLVSFFLFQLSLIVFFLLLRQYYNEICALIAVFIFNFSFYAFYYNDFFQQTALDMLLLLLHLYSFSNFIRKDSTTNYIKWLIFGTLNFLVRPVFLVLLLPIVVYLYKKYGFFFVKKPKIFAFFFISLTLTAAWYIYGYYVTGKELPGFYSGYFEPWKIFYKHSSFYIFRFLRFMAESMIRNFTLFGFILIFIGFFIYVRSKKLDLWFWWTLAIIIQFFLIPEKVMIHRHYLLPLLLSLSLFVALPLSYLYEKMYKTKFKRLGVYFLGCIFIAYSLLNIPDAIHQKTQVFEYIKPLAGRVSEKTKPEDRIIFIGDKIADVWNHVWLYASDRCGFQMNLDSNIARHVNSIVSGNNISNIAIIKVSKNYNSKEMKECTNLKWLMAKYRLIDYFEDAYFLLNSEQDNVALSQRPGFQKLNLNYENGGSLHGMSISEPYKNNGKTYTDVTFMWTKNDYKERKDYCFVSINSTDGRLNLTHKILGDIYTVEQWRPNKIYSETIQVNIGKSLNLDRRHYFYFLLYNPSTGHILKPKATKGNELVIEMDIKNKAIRTVNAKEFSPSFKRTNCPFLLFEKEELRNAVNKNFSRYNNLINIQNTIERSRLRL